MRTLPCPSTITFSGFRSRWSTPLVVGGAQPDGELARDVERLVAPQPADAPHEAREVLAVHVLHGEEVLPVGASDVEDAAHRGVRDLARDPHLAEEPLEALLVCLHGGGKELERDGLAQRQVVRAVHLAHASFAEQAHDAIASREHHSGNEAAVGGSRRDAGRARRASESVGPQLLSAPRGACRGGARFPSGSPTRRLRHRRRDSSDGSPAAPAYRTGNAASGPLVGYFRSDGARRASVRKPAGAGQRPSRSANPQVSQHERGAVRDIG